MSTFLVFAKFFQVDPIGMMGDGNGKRHHVVTATLVLAGAINRLHLQCLLGLRLMLD